MAKKEAPETTPEVTQTPEIKIRGRAWKLAPDVEIGKYRGQLAEVLLAIASLPDGGTVDQISEAVVFSQPTRQTNKRIVAYYVSLMKGDGKLVPAS